MLQKLRTGDIDFMIFNRQRRDPRAGIRRAFDHFVFRSEDQLIKAIVDPG